MDNQVVLQNPQMTKVQGIYHAKLQNVDREARARLEETATITFQEHYAYQAKQSQAHAMGRIPTDIAQDLYNILGGTVDAFNGRPLEQRLVAIKALGEMVEAGI